MKHLGQLRDKAVEFINTSRRILSVSRKPDWDEFKVMVKITGLGIVLISFMGFVIALVFAFFRLGR